MNSPHYTFVDQIGNKIFHRYWDGESKIEEVYDFPIELFIKGAREDSRGIHGEVLSKIEYSNIQSAREFISEHGDVMPIYGQTSWAHQFIAHRYPGDIKFNIDNFKIVALDIETRFTDEFPTPAKAAQEILAITCKIFGRPGFVTWGLMPYQKQNPEDEYWLCSTETDLLASFIGWWTREKPDIVTGWNIVGFDVPYIINRIRNVLGDSVANKFSPLHQYTSRVFTEVEIQNNQISYRVAGLNILDYLEVYKKFSMGSRENYKLDTIAQLELGEEKLDYSEYSNLMDLYNNDHQKYIDYNIHDVRLIEKMDRKLKFMFLAITLAYMGKVKIHEIFGQVKFWDNLVYVELLKRNIQIPPHERKKSAGEIEGAYVKDPKPGLYRWVASLDLTSLYPSIIMALNMSPETIASPAVNERILDQLIDMSFDTSEIHRNNLAMAANGSTYLRDVKGIMPEITAHMFGGRKSFKNKMLDAKRQAEAIKKELETNPSSELRSKLRQAENDIASFDAMQMALKIALNSLYGAQANEHFRYYDPNIAEGITLTGQCVIRYISDRMNEFMNEKLKTQGVDYVAANDTDSAYLVFERLVDKVCPADLPVQKKVDFLDKFINTYLQPFIDERFEDLARYLNCVDNKFSMKREAIGDKAIWRGKKNYIMQVYDNEGVRYTTPDLKMMGVETARSSTPRICKTALEKGYDILLNGTEQDLIEHVAQFKELFMQSPIEAIAFPRGVSDMDKWMDKGTMWKTGTPIHVKSAIMYNSLIRKHKLAGTHALIKNGDKIKFIYLKEPNPTHCNVIGFVDTLLPVFELDEYINRALQYEKSFLHPLESFSNLVGMHTKKTIKLDSFFSDDDAETVAPVSQVNIPTPAEIVREKPKPTSKPAAYEPVPRKAAPVKKAKASLDSFFD